MPAERQALAAFVRRCREDAGYATARAFYGAQGGKSFFGCSYKAYMNLENGRSLPSPLLVERLAAAYRMALSPDRAREFAAAYVGALLGDADACQWCLRALSDGGGEASAAGHTPVRLTERQFSAVFAGPEPYWCFTLLSNDRGRFLPEDLASRLGLGLPAARRALESLRRAGLVARDGAGRYRSPLVGKMILQPGGPTDRPRAAEAARACWEWAARRGEVLLDHPLFARCSESELRGYFPHLAQTVLGAASLARTEPGPDTGFFLIEATVKKVLPF